MAMGVKPENFPESIDQFNEVLQGKSATCLLKKREYESNGQKKSTLDLDEDFAGQNQKKTDAKTTIAQLFTEIIRSERCGSVKIL